MDAQLCIVALRLSSRRAHFLLDNSLHPAKNTANSARDAAG
jgi:hypothetical protein